jgi:hypothetical protein
MTTPRMSSEEIRAAAEIHSELGPEYGDAVVESFMRRIDEEIRARVDAHLASAPQPRTRPALPAPPDPAVLAKRRSVLTGVAIGAVGAGVPVTMFAYRAAEYQDNRGFLAAIWFVITVIFIATGFASGAFRLPGRR